MCLALKRFNCRAVGMPCFRYSSLHERLCRFWKRSAGFMLGLLAEVCIFYYFGPPNGYVVNYAYEYLAAG